MNGRYVRPNHETRVPRRIVCIDCESVESEQRGRSTYYVHTWRCGAASFDRLDNGVPVRSEAVATERQEEYWDWILDHTHKRERLWVCAHNLAFDLTVSDIWQLARDRDIKITRWLVDDPPTIIDATWRGRKIRMCCLGNYWPGTVDGLSECLHGSPGNVTVSPSNQRQWLSVCQHHVDTVRRYMLAWIWFVKHHDLGNFKATLAAQSMAIYTHRYMPFRILSHGDQEFAAVERDGYFGGRCQVGFVGHTSATTHHYDVNSLYPFVMSQATFPTEPIHRCDYIDRERLLVSMQKCAAVAEVTVQTDSEVYPKRVNGRVYYPVGKYRTVLCGAELERALCARTVTDVGRCMLYRASPIFEGWVEAWATVLMQAKRDGDKLLATISKHLLNSLSGKWAQKQHTWQPCNWLKPESDYYHWWYSRHSTGERYECRSIAGCVQTRQDLPDEYGGLVAISAHITSAGRVRMDCLKNYCSQGRVYYQDTDSLIVDRIAADGIKRAGLVDPVRFGLLKHVCDYSNLTIEGPRRWHADGKAILPGIRCDASEISDGVFLQETRQGASSILRRDPEGQVLVRPTLMKLKPLSMGVVVEDGGWTRPLILDE